MMVVKTDEPEHIIVITGNNFNAQCGRHGIDITHTKIIHTFNI